MKTETDEVYDWSMAMEPFLEHLERLRDHIEGHHLFRGWETAVAEINAALALAEPIREDDYATSCYDDEWVAFWDYVRDKMLDWWC